MVPQTRTTTTSAGESRRLRTLSVFIVPLLAAGLVMAACVGDVPEVPTDDAQLIEGRTIYSANCVACHGPDGSGRIGSKLNEGAVVAAYPDAVDEFTVIADGKNRMPAFGGKLTAEEIEAVVRFTREGL